jgi:hypothetical protein
MQKVAESFNKATVNEIVKKSREENAWSDNADEYKMINYNYGFNLKYPA